MKKTIPDGSEWKDRFLDVYHKVMGGPFRKIVIKTLDPVFPATCPGCDSPADSKDLVSGANKFEEIKSGIFGGVYRYVKYQIPMCSRCSRYRLRVLLPATIGIIVGASLLALVVSAALNPGPTYAIDGGDYSQPTAIGRMLRAFLTISPYLAMVAAILAVWNRRPARITDFNEEHGMVEFSSRRAGWIDEIARLNPHYLPEE